MPKLFGLSSKENFGGMNIGPYGTRLSLSNICYHRLAQYALPSELSIPCELLVSFPYNINCHTNIYLPSMLSLQLIHTRLFASGSMKDVVTGDMEAPQSATLGSRHSTRISSSKDNKPSDS